MVSILVAVTILLTVYLIYNFVNGKPPNSPPGLPRLPIWGSYWFLLWGDYYFPYKAISYYVKKYQSKIIGLYLGDNYTIVVNDYFGIKEVLRRQEFDGRVGEIHLAKARAFGQKLGIFFNDDTEWLTQRRFALRYLRDFGFGRRHEKFESVVAHEVHVLMDILKKGPSGDLEKTIANNSLALFPDVLYASCSNPIWFVMTGEMYDRQDYETLRKVCRKAMLFQRNADTAGGAITLTSWLRHFGNGFGFKRIMEGNYAMVDFIKNFVNKRKKSSHMEENEPEGFIDVYLNKLKQLEGKDGFSEKQLLIVCVDVIFPALSAVPSMLTHIIKLMMHHPEVMKKVQNEIDNVVGRDCLPELNDRHKLPYTEATIREALRMETLTPWSVFHRTTEATTLMGYDIPNNTVVITNLSHMHNDPEFWGDPENFRPERFLTEDGKALAKDYTFAFGLGRRVCAGETFARFLLFSHFAAFAQNFNFEFVEHQPTSLKDVLPGLITTPKETWIRVVSR
ncbi:probable cytochrome P450 304a1 [Venturia canescens]|uniref:probable cytochrome P450 304a1 n=1 Tax=Venturia canescens TaxID=32260 RepID=UPI001C9C400B|nr:probable cytochrome P450 304a1 [Venturia canescens]